MNKQLMTGVGIGVVIAAAAAAVASYSGKRSAPEPLAATDTPSAITAAPVGDTAPARPEGDALATTAPAGATSETESAPAPAETAAPTVTRPVTSPRARSPSYALVVSSTPVTDTQRVPREDCHDEQVTRQKPVKDEKRIAGAAIGALVGGVLGNQVGDGNGKKLATAAGAIAGGVAGSKIQGRVQEGNTETVTEKRCTTVYDVKERTLGYDVQYKLEGNMHTIRMAANPAVGSKLPVRNGEVVAATH